MNREQMVERVAEMVRQQQAMTMQPTEYDIAFTVLDAVLPQITTAAELEALPAGSIVLRGAHLLQSKRLISGQPLVWFEFHDGGWRGSGLLSSRGIADGSPLTVVWQPEPERKV